VGGGLERVGRTPQHTNAKRLLAGTTGFVAKLNMINFLDEPLIFKGCASSHPGVIQGMPTKGTVYQPGEGSRVTINATDVLTSVSLDGQCWWETQSKIDCNNGTNHTFPGEVSSCPFVTWVRGVNLKNKSIGANWDVETPHQLGESIWGQLDSVHHRNYCTCKEGSSRSDCDALCAAPPTPAPPPSPQPTTHYTNPATGCAYDEKAMDVSDDTGAKGQICAPKCVRSHGIIPRETCSQDFPAGTTANPGCEFEDDDSNTKYCSLDCRSTGSKPLLCADGAFCFETTDPPAPPIRNVSVTYGFCGYK
jgi:hypothetical protein